MKFVMSLLFNFVTWLPEFLEDIDASEYVEVDEKHAVKVFAICEDLITISNKGKIKTQITSVGNNCQANYGLF